MVGENLLGRHEGTLAPLDAPQSDSAAVPAVADLEKSADGQSRTSQAARGNRVRPGSVNRTELPRARSRRPRCPPTPPPTPAPPPRRPLLPRARRRRPARPRSPGSASAPARAPPPRAARAGGAGRERRVRNEM